MLDKHAGQSLPWAYAVVRAPCPLGMLTSSVRACLCGAHDESAPGHAEHEAQVWEGGI